MTKKQSSAIDVQGTAIRVLSVNKDDYICITDIARHKNQEGMDDIIRTWLRNRNTIEYLGVWERLNNPAFNPVEFDGFRVQAGLNRFILTPKEWIEKTGAIGIIAKQGRYGGTYAHKDIAFEFAAWVSVEFKLYLIKEFQRLKNDESDRLKLGWNLQRTLAKINYQIHTDAIRDELIPASITNQQASFIYADEADLLNVALFGQTARQWRAAHPGAPASENIRDQATAEQLIVMSNLESVNSVLIRQGLPQADRLVRLNEAAIFQLRSLSKNNNAKRLQ
ncbi:MAG: KilA-N domain-containing protein [Lacunisphaera sp.]|nr:KilA-N domain-containing protein [Lacunisphaera sp.]